MKLAIISRHPAPYRDSLLCQFANDSRFRTDIFNELKFDEGHDFWNLKEHGYAAKPLYGSSYGRVGRLIHLIRKVIFGKYDFVVWAGFNTFELTAAMIISALCRRSYGFMADTIEQRPTNMFRILVKKLIVQRAALILVPGKAGVQFWERTYGVPPSKICKGAYALDGEKIHQEIFALRRHRTVLRERYGLASDDTIFLMVANMIHTRHYPITAAGFAKFASSHPRCRFIMVGRGPDLESMQSLAQKSAAFVVIPGCSFDEMKSLYAIADIYVHGGNEPASTALVIGAIAGVPLISSDAVGCSADVLRDGESGIKVSDYLSEESWVDGFERLFERRNQWSKMGVEAYVLSREMNVDNVYENIVQTILEGGVLHE